MKIGVIMEYFYFHSSSKEKRSNKGDEVKASETSSAYEVTDEGSVMADEVFKDGGNRQIS